MQGIRFTPDNHKAIRDKLKTQTRRLYNLKEINQEPAIWFVEWEETLDTWLFASDNGEGKSVNPRYRVGETVYIKEPWAVDKRYDHFKPSEISHDVRRYFKDSPLLRYGYTGRWRSPMFMPAWVARDFIKITDVRPERLQDITEKDAIAEGINPAIKEHDSSIDLRLKFAWLWNDTNKTYPFESDPWCWRICFNLIEGNR